MKIYSIYTVNAERGTKEEISLFRRKRLTSEPNALRPIQFKEEDGTIKTVLDTSTIATDPTIMAKADKCFSIAMSLVL